MKTVRYEEMLPHEFKAALREFPVAYVPVGSLEWHGRHLPYGVDSIIPHGILVAVAKKYGGIVLPATYWGRINFEKWKDYVNPKTSFGTHPGLPEELLFPFYSAIFNGLVSVGFRVVIGVTGHGEPGQLTPLQKAAGTITVPGRTAGFAMMEHELNLKTGEVGLDHAAKWETSYMLALRPDLVEMEHIKHENLETPEGRRNAVIHGMDPRLHSSARVGEKAMDMIVDAIGNKAQELLSSVGFKSEKKIQ